jgi:hypothetical protein
MHLYLYSFLSILGLHTNLFNHCSLTQILRCRPYFCFEISLIHVVVEYRCARHVARMEEMKKV